MRKSHLLVSHPRGAVHLIPCWVLQSWGKQTSSGLLVHLVQPARPALSSLGIQALLVRVESNGELHIGSQIVSWEDFDSVLRKELGRRPPTWPVYVEGDANMEWRQVARAIDAIKGAQAEVVLLTRATP